MYFSIYIIAKMHIGDNYLTTTNEIKKFYAKYTRHLPKQVPLNIAKCALSFRT